jgi:hypothetical protein
MFDADATATQLGKLSWMSMVQAEMPKLSLCEWPQLV